MFDELAAMRQAGRRIGGIGRLPPFAAAPALDRETQAAPAGRDEQLIETEHVLGAAAQPAERMFGIGLDDDDKERDACRDRLDFGRCDDYAGRVEDDRVVAQITEQHGLGLGQRGGRVGRGRRPCAAMSLGERRQLRCTADQEQAKRRMHDSVTVVARRAAR